MSEVIVFPDVEDLVRLHLTAALAEHDSPVPVHVSIPNPRPNTFVTAPRVGGPARNPFVDAATLSVSSWALTPGPALALAQLVRALLNALPGQILGGFPVYRVDEFTGPANLPDSLSSHSRYVQAVSVCIRGKAI